jgi:hypothetical protein
LALTCLHWSNNSRPEPKSDGIYHATGFTDFPADEGYICFTRNSARDADKVEDGTRDITSGARELTEAEEIDGEVDAIDVLHLDRSADEQTGKGTAGRVNPVMDTWIATKQRLGRLLSRSGGQKAVEDSKA